MPRRSFDRTAAIFGVLRNRDLRSLWFSDWISDVGNFITAIALAVYVNNLTGTATGAGARPLRGLLTGTAPGRQMAPLTGPRSSGSTRTPANGPMVNHGTE